VTIPFDNSPFTIVSFYTYISKKANNRNWLTKNINVNSDYSDVSDIGSLKGFCRCEVNHIQTYSISNIDNAGDLKGDDHYTVKTSESDDCPDFLRNKFGDLAKNPLIYKPEQEIPVLFKSDAGKSKCESLYGYTNVQTLEDSLIANKVLGKVSVHELDEPDYLSHKLTGTDALDDEHSEKYIPVSFIVQDEYYNGSVLCAGIDKSVLSGKVSVSEGDEPDYLGDKLVGTPIESEEYVPVMFESTELADGYEVLQAGILADEVYKVRAGIFDESPGYLVDKILGTDIGEFEDRDLYEPVSVIHFYRDDYNHQYLLLGIEKSILGKVAVSEGDTPDYLSSKLVGTDALIDAEDAESYIPVSFTEQISSDNTSLLCAGIKKGFLGKVALDEFDEPDYLSYKLQGTDTYPKQEVVEQYVPVSFIQPMNSDSINSILYAGIEKGRFGKVSVSEGDEPDYLGNKLYGTDSDGYVPVIFEAQTSDNNSVLRAGIEKGHFGKVSVSKGDEPDYLSHKLTGTDALSDTLSEKYVPVSFIVQDKYYNNGSGLCAGIDKGYFGKVALNASDTADFLATKLGSGFKIENGKITLDFKTIYDEMVKRASECE
jgi:hypothetical protein